MSEAAPSPEQPEDLSTVSTADLVIRLIRELEIRHQQDVFFMFLKRPSDGGVPSIFSRLSGDAYAVEGASGVLYRWIKHRNNRDGSPFIGESWTDEPVECGPVPGADPDVE